MKNYFTNLSYLMMFCLLSWGTTAWAQPANDDCVNATPLTIGGGLIAGTTVGAVPPDDPVGCASDYGVWYTFVGDGTDLTINSPTTFDHEVDLFTASAGCGSSYTTITCDDGSTGTETHTFTSTAGTTYYLYVAHYSPSSTTTGTFDIEVTGPPMAPANDDCAGATNVPVEAADPCTGSVAGTTVGATQSLSGCLGTANDDVWFEFTATGADHEILISYVSGSSDIVTEVYEGGCAGTPIECQDTPNSPITLTGLTAGTQYAFRVYSYSSSATVTSTFTVCVSTVAPPPPPPANDDCAGALPLSVSATSACESPVSGTTNEATASAEDDCSTTNKDVWYDFTPATTGPYQFSVTETFDSGFSSTYVSVFSGGCGALVDVTSSCFSSSQSASLTAGTTYKVNVRSTSTTAYVDFDLCVYALPPPPVNDVCTGAIPYPGTIGAAGTCPTNNVSLDLGPYSNSASPFPSCDLSGNYNAWFTFTATAETLIFTSGTGSPGIAVYSGACGALTQLGCLNNTSGSLAGLTIGASYIMEVWDDTDNSGTVTWCLEEAPAPPVNDACAGAIPVVAGAGTASGTTAAASNIEGLSACSGGGTCGGGTGTINFGAGVWFVYTSTVAEEITIDTDGSSFDTELQVFEGSCGALSCVAGDDDSGDTGSNSLVCFTTTASAAPPGSASASAPVNYYIYVDGHLANSGNFILNISTTALPVTLTSFKGEKMENANKLSWVTAVEENTEMHILERSADGNRWSEIGKVEAQGFSYENKYYEMLDKDPLAKSFYRLKSLDFDASFQYSEVISLERASEGFSLSRVFPVPSKGELSVEFNIKRNENVDIMITDMVGRVIFQDQVDAADGTNLYNTDISDFAQGVYFISLNNGVETLTQRIIKN